MTDKVKLRPISESQRSCLECYYGNQLLGGYPAWCLHTGNKIHELVGCELWRKNCNTLQQRGGRMKKYTSEEIKNRLSNIGEAIGTISLEYIAELEKENKQLKARIEKMKSCENCKHRYYENGINYCNNRCQKNLYNNWELKE